MSRNNGLDEKKVENEDRFNHIMELSLRDISTVSLATSIYKHEDIFKEIRQYNCHSSDRIEYLLYQKLPVLPKSLIEKTKDVCKFVASEGNCLLGLVKGFNAPCRCGFNFKIPVEYFDCISFKMDGTVDKIETFTLINERNDPDYKILIAACHLCSAELISQSWDKLFPTLTASAIRKIRDNVRKKDGFDDCMLVQYWVHYLLHVRVGDLIYLENSREMFEESLNYFNPYASKYFYKMLTDEEKKDNLEGYIEQAFDKTNGCEDSELRETSVECLDIALFLLSQLSDVDDQIELLRVYLPRIIYPFILNSFYQKFLEPVLQLVWTSLDEDDFNRVFLVVFKIIRKRNHIAGKVCRKLWSQTPTWYHELFFDYLIEEGRAGDLFSNLRDIGIDIRSWNIIELIMADCTDEEKADHLKAPLTYPDFINSLKLRVSHCLNVLSDFLSLIFSSQTIVTSFKKYLVDSNYSDLVSWWMMRHDYDSIDKFLAWGLSSQTEIDEYKTNNI